jgi:Fe2+ transport system protein FeoA
MRAATDLAPHEVAVISGFADMVVAGRLMAMGVMPHSQIELIRRNALGYTLIFRVGSRFKIALRRDEAQTIYVVD